MSNSVVNLQCSDVGSGVARAGLALLLPPSLPVDTERSPDPLEASILSHAQWRERHHPPHQVRRIHWDNPNKRLEYRLSHDTYTVNLNHCYSVNLPETTQLGELNPHLSDCEAIPTLLGVCLFFFSPQLPVISIHSVRNSRCREVSELAQSYRVGTGQGPQKA